MSMTRLSRASKPYRIAIWKHLFRFFSVFGALANTVELLLRPVPTLLESWPLLTQLRQHRFDPYVSGFIAIAVLIFS
jgi:hypothetical protein